MAWIQTYSGKAFDPLKPDLDQICIEDIAHALSHQCRFSGHTNSFYSVAQHSVEVATRLAPEFQAHALLHDAAEAYLLDIPSPLKQLPEFDFYRAAEEDLERAIFDRFGLPANQDTARILAEVKKMDKQVLQLERRLLLGACERPWEAVGEVAVLPAAHRVGWRPWAPAHAKNEFLNMFHLTINAL